MPYNNNRLLKHPIHFIKTLIRNAHEALKFPWNTLKTFLVHPCSFPETTLRLVWITYENFFPLPYNETHNKHSSKFLKTVLNRPWNFLHTPFHFNILKTPLKQPWNTIKSRYSINLRAPFRFPWNILETLMNTLNTL